MTGQEHFRRAEELAAEAHKLLGEADGQATAGVRAAAAQAHAVLLTAATAVGARWPTATPGSASPGPGSNPAHSL